MVGFVLLMIGLGIYCGHLSMSVNKADVHRNLTASLSKPVGVFEICGFMCVCMFLFESNLTLLKVKNQMTDSS